jgi:Xaa-Pro aminopeptidase
VPFQLEKIQEAIRGEELDGWLFCNFHHRDKLSDEILHLKTDTVNSRTWVYAVPARGEPRAIVHAIESGALDALPGQKIVYAGRDDFAAALVPLAGKRWGAHVSTALTAISRLDAGTAAVFEGAGLRLVSAAALIQRFKGLLDGAGIQSHERAARHLYAIVAAAWDVVKKAHAEGKPLYEGDIQTLMLDAFRSAHIASAHPPIVGSGEHTADPHYTMEGRGARFSEGDVVQFDLWAKENTDGAIYADISWVGVYAEYGARPTSAVERVFTELVQAREAAYRSIHDELAAGLRPEGRAIDALVRARLVNAGYAAALRHRTGHGIDTEVHGSGVNIDSVEFPDERLLLDGACFSLEPGLYFPRGLDGAGPFGLRTEIDVYIQAGRPVISGAERQFRLLYC